MSAPTKHFRLSPSGSSRWLACPYSAQEGFPEDTNQAANDGKQTHDAAAELLLAADGPAVRFPNKKFANAAAVYVDHVLANRADKLYVEEQWVSSSIPDYGGTADVVLVKDTRLAVYDFKTGKWPVSARDNPQLLSYADLVQDVLGEQFDEVYGVIIQPLSMKGYKPDIALYNQDQIALHHADVAAAAVSDHKQTGDHCRFCPVRKLGKGHCLEGDQYAKQKGWRT